MFLLFFRQRIFLKPTLQYTSYVNLWHILFRNAITYFSFIFPARLILALHLLVFFSFTFLIHRSRPRP